MKHPWFFGVLGGVALAGLDAGAKDLPDPTAQPVAFLRAALERVCPVGEPDPAALARPFPDAVVRAVRPLSVRGRTAGWTATIRFGQDHELRLQRRGDGARLRRFNVELYREVPGRRARPIAAGSAGPDCRILGGRRIRYGAEGRQSTLEILSRDLTTVERREPLNPPIPPARPPGGVSVALFDAGVNYTLPQVAERLARAPNGRALGFDFWDMDALPFDANPARSPFYPVRHGTPVASVLLREAPRARLLPYRYPRPDMRRMAAMVAAANANGAVIVAMPMGSNKTDPWPAFVAAAKAHPHMLFIVSAGNNGRDIDARPVYPAAFDLANLLVVTSSTLDGRLAPGSNWGAESVDLMVPAEDVAVIEFSGKTGRASGSSYAVARIAALAVRLLAKNSNWRGPQLKQAILARARFPTSTDASRVKHGWIADPTGG